MIEEQQGYKPGRKQMKQIKEAVTDELLPRAFALRRHTFAWIDPTAGTHGGGCARTLRRPTS